MADTRHNGYKNYETWNVALWINNDEGSLGHHQAMIADLNDYGASKAIEESIRYDNPLADDASMFSDILSASLSEVDWLEVVEAIRPDEN